MRAQVGICLKRAARLAPALALLAGLSVACKTNPFQQSFDEKVVYGPLMQLAANPDDVIPGFEWADAACETLGGGGGGGGGSSSSGGGGGCPT